MAEQFLTPGSRGEVAELTGAHTRAGQIRNLATNGIRHSINAAGWPIVTWAAVNGTAGGADAARPAWKSNAKAA